MLAEINLVRLKRVNVGSAGFDSGVSKGVICSFKSTLLQYANPRTTKFLHSTSPLPGSP
ncbi:protein of unknown function [Pseudodesulfovibrio profundus]|uniref:Uncharacterized protein n=1 Tax=Pseudodesulfovibrio profundus TaxID=57320 RepID=A0A2C8FE31_9BACT|nr:protein of unknown function [Pseudodesulfovibrio profundus]